MRAFLHDVIQTLHQFRTVFNQLVAAFAVRIVYRTGHRHHLPSHLRRQLGGNQRTGFQRSLNHQRNLRQRGNQAVAAREVARKRARVQRKLADNQPFFGDFVGKAFIGRRINAVYARPPDGDGAAARLQRTLVGGSVDARSHARHDGNALFTQRPAEILGNPHCLRRSMAAADDGGGIFVQ